MNGIFEDDFHFKLYYKYKLSFLLQSCISVETTGANMPGSPLTTHVLDTSKGQPARALPIQLYKSVGDDKWSSIVQG